MNSFRLGLMVCGVAVVGLFSAYVILDPVSQACLAQQSTNPRLVCGRYAELALVLTLVFTAVLTLFGTLALPGAQDESGNFREQRIRFSIAITILILYLIYFSMAIFWQTGTNKDLVATLTNLMMVVIPFYFGASAAAQIAKRRD